MTAGPLSEVSLVSTLVGGDTPYTSRPEVSLVSTLVGGDTPYTSRPEVSLVSIPPATDTGKKRISPPFPSWSRVGLDTRRHSRHNNLFNKNR
jgi:hypothetical protein